ncbi:MAG: adenylosuccinate lyase, partial [Bacteroidota bacterium]
MLDNLFSISPIDGRYRAKTEPLAGFFSEYALFKYRVMVEAEYLIALDKLNLEGWKKLDNADIETIKSWYLKFDLRCAQRIKEIEKVTNHDVKAVEYFLKEKIAETHFDSNKEFIHFGLTSQDVNNTAIPKMMLDAMTQIYFPSINNLIEMLEKQSDEWWDVPMLARTHGQPASPTRLGKEWKVFSERLKIQLESIKTIKVAAKFGGATGNFNAHVVTFPQVDWIKFSDEFIASLGLTRTKYTTQIEPYDNLATICDNLKRINNILIDFSRDVWQYISMEYFKQKIKDGEVGSSAMPHKVNPIDFENAEGNLGMANALLEFFSAKLPISRLQRDLTDSTVLRNLGMPFAYQLVSTQSIARGLNKLLINKEKFAQDLENNWMVVSEGIQTILRSINYPNPYEALKELTRTNSKVNQETFKNFILTLNIDDDIKKRLLELSPSN